MLHTIAILTMALTTQAPTQEQQRQAQLKVLAAKIHQESLAKRANTKAKAKPPAPEPKTIIQYVEVPRAEPGSILYLWTDHLSKVPMTQHLFDLRTLQPLILADDRTTIEELQSEKRQPCIPIETAVKVLQFEGSAGPRLPACEVRILEGPFQGQKGWVLEYLLRDRVEVSLKKARHRR